MAHACASLCGACDSVDDYLESCADSDDEDIVEAVDEALTMAEGFTGEA